MRKIESCSTRFFDFLERKKEIKNRLSFLSLSLCVFLPFSLFSATTMNDDEIYIVGRHVFCRFFTHTFHLSIIIYITKTANVATESNPTGETRPPRGRPMTGENPGLGTGTTVDAAGMLHLS